MEGRATSIRWKSSPDEFTEQLREGKIESDDESVDTILQQERSRREQQFPDTDGDIAMLGMSPPAQHVGRREFEHEGAFKANTAVSSINENGGNEVTSTEANNTESQGDRLVDINLSKTHTDREDLPEPVKAASGVEDSQHRDSTQNIKNTNDSIRSTNAARDERYEENASAYIKPLHGIKNGNLMITLQDPETFQDTQARVKGETPARRYTVISFDSIPASGAPGNYHHSKPAR